MIAANTPPAVSVPSNLYQADAALEILMRYLSAYLQEVERKPLGFWSKPEAVRDEFRKLLRTQRHLVGALTTVVRTLGQNPETKVTEVAKPEKRSDESSVIPFKPRE
jgi:hypothetical protein